MTPSTTFRSQTAPVVIGVDFDNTIVCYDDLFHRVAVERRLVPSDLPPFKSAVREYLRTAGQDEQWTELQGLVYGPRLRDAMPFPGVLSFFSRALRSGGTVHIISHKTRQPVIGPSHDLHQAARDWLTAQRFFDPARSGLSAARVHFCATREEKINCINVVGCKIFIDDLEEVFREPLFPANVEQILFAPRGADSPPAKAMVMKDWSEISQHVFASRQ